MGERHRHHTEGAPETLRGKSGDLAVCLTLGSDSTLHHSFKKSRYLSLYYE